MSRPARPGEPGTPPDVDATIFGRAQWNEIELELMDQNFRHQLQAAIEAGAECCPVGVSTVPGTKRPILGYKRPDANRL
jgi:hypothetical protein